MSNSQNFRSAFNGFNREDVVHYLEYLNSKHTSLVNQLSQEADNLRQKLNLAADAIEPILPVPNRSWRWKANAMR